MAIGRVTAVLGALGLMLALVMPWYGRRAQSTGRGSDIEVFTAFQWFSAVDIALLVLALAGPLPEENFVLRYGARFAITCAATMTIGAFVALCGSIGSTIDQLYTARR